MKDEIIKSFLSKTIQVCDRCGKVDINTYARYKLEDDKYVLNGIYSRCQHCEKIKEFTKDEIKQELGGYLL